MQSLRDLLAQIEDVDTETLRQANRAIVEELNHRARKEQQLRSIAVAAGQHGRLTNIKPKMLSGVTGTIVRLSSDPKFAYFKPDSQFAMGRYLGRDGMTKIWRSSFKADEVAS